MISWYSKKQNSISLSTEEAKYIDAESYCTQLMWMKQMLEDYDIFQDTLCVYCDNISTINISKNTVQHSRTKHIYIRHHFIRKLVENKTVVIEHVTMKKQLANIFTKTLDSTIFFFLRKALGICTM